MIEVSIESEEVVIKMSVNEAEDIRYFIGVIPYEDTRRLVRDTAVDRINKTLDGLFKGLAETLDGGQQ